jgi:hypothetical protein
MARLTQHFRRRAFFHNAAKIHHGHTVTGLAYNRQIVTNEKIREAAPPA